MDEFFIELIKGLKTNDYWVNYSEGYVTDLRLSYHFLKYMEGAFFVGNVFNREYMEIPGNTNVPRTFSLQLSAQF
jgi:outer membrane receptor protein involved in Fe transport